MTSENGPGEREPGVRESVPPVAKPGMIGRLHEVETIVDIVRRASVESEPYVVTIIGSPGVGKSRLITDVLADLNELLPDVRSYRGACRPESGIQSALTRLLRTRFGMQEGTDAVTLAAELQTQVTELFGDRRVQEILHFLGAFMGLEFGGTPLADAIEDDRRAFQQVSRAVLRRFLEVDAQRSPLVLVIEDLHYASADGIRLVREIAETMHNAPVVFLITARPELLANAREWPHILPGRHQRIDLGPLSAGESQALARSLLARLDTVPHELIEAASSMGGGNPLLIEQLVNIFFDQGVVTVGPDGVARVALDRLDTISLPMSVEDAVRQRLAALSPAERELLEMGAVMGPVFWLGGLVVLGRARKDVPELWGGGEDLAHHYRDLLAGLDERDYVLRMPDSTIGDDAEWIFKHNMEREMIARLVNVDDAKGYHLILAEWLEFRLKERTEEQLDLLAFHYERGNRQLRAARCYLESADRARARYANIKAIDAYERGVALLGDFDIRLLLDAHHHLGDVLQIVGRTDDAHKHFKEMLGLAFRLDLKSKGGAAHNRIGRLFRETGRLDMAMRHLGTGLALFEAAGDARGIASSYDDIGKVHWLRGNFDQALRYLQDALSRREAMGDKRSIALSLNNIGLVFQDSGQYRAAFDALTRALELRREVEDLPGVTLTLNNLGTIHQDKGEDEEAIRLWQEGLEVAREIGDRKRQAIVMLNIGEGQYRLRNLEESSRMLHEVEQISQELGDRILLAEAWRGLGKAQLLKGDIAGAQTWLEKSVELFEQTRSRVHVGIAKRTLGECLSTWGYDSDHGKRAEQYFREALDVFDEAGAELEYARTARTFAELLRTAPETAGAGLADEADRLRLRADEIFTKLRANAPEPAWNEADLGGRFIGGEGTNPALHRVEAIEGFDGAGLFERTAEHPVVDVPVPPSGDGG